MTATYRIRLRDMSHYDVDADGNILHDAFRHLHFAPDGQWRILGFTTRHNAHHIITLAEASDGKSIGQGWIHDLDHGTHRMWASPKYHRAESVTRIVG